MIANPKKGAAVVVWYRASNRHLPYHSKPGTVLTPGKGKPRNHLVDIGGERVVVPCGNLRKQPGMGK